MHYTLEIFISPSIRIDLHLRHWEPITCIATSLLAPGEELSLVSVELLQGFCSCKEHEISPYG